MSLPVNLLTLIEDLAEAWGITAGIPVLYAGLTSRDLGSLVIVIDAPSLDYADSPSCDAGPSSVTVTAHLVAQSTEDLGVTDLYARIIPTVAAIPAGWDVTTVTPAQWPSSGDGSPCYSIALAYA